MTTITKTSTEAGLKRTQKAREVYKQLREQRSATARDNKSSNIASSPTPTVIRGLKDIDRVTKDMMTSLANKDGRFTVAEVRVFASLVAIYRQNQEAMESRRAMTRMLREHNANQ